jgi:hypothetical protein
MSRQISLPTQWPLGVTFRDWLAWNATEEDIQHNLGQLEYKGQATFCSRTREEARYAFADRFLEARK